MILPHMSLEREGGGRYGESKIYHFNTIIQIVPSIPAEKCLRLDYRIIIKSTPNLGLQLTQHSSRTTNRSDNFKLLNILRTKTLSTKRKNRGKVQCQECEFVLISDQQETS